MNIESAQNGKHSVYMCLCQLLLLLLLLLGHLHPLLLLEQLQCCLLHGCLLFFARRHILSPVKTVRSNLHCKTTLQQNPVGRVTRWMPLTPLGQC